MELAFECIGSFFDAQETEVIIDALMQFTPPENYGARKKIILEELRTRLQEASSKA